VVRVEAKRAPVRAGGAYRVRNTHSDAAKRIAVQTKARRRFAANREDRAKSVL